MGKDKLLKVVLGLDYNGLDVPELTDMKTIEILSLIGDYEDFVLSVHLITVKEFLKIRTIIYNAELNKYKIGDIVYFYHSVKGFMKSSIIDKYVEEDGTVICMLNNYEYEVGAGELYKQSTKWYI